MLETPWTRPPIDRRHPAVGVVVPCKDEIGAIARCLGALRRQEPAVQRIVVVDNGSTDGSLEVALELADEVVEAPTGSIAALRNLGARALGPVDVLAFVDADTEVAPGWLEAGLEALAGGADLVGSRTDASEDAGWVARRWAAVEQATAHDASRVWSQHLLVRATAFAAAEGFDEHLLTGEDADLSARVDGSGGRVALVPAMRATHHGFPDDFGAFLRRELWHTRAAGWFPPMSRSSRALVLGGLAWTVAGGAAAAAALRVRRLRLLAGWGAASAVGVPALGLLATRRPGSALQDGVLLATWTAVRVLRLARGVRRRPGT